MADQVVIGSGRALQLGNEAWEIVDPGEVVKFVDLILEMRAVQGCVYLTLGSGVVEFGNPGRVQIASRLRMSIEAAHLLHGMLGELISDALKPADPKQAN